MAAFEGRWSYENLQESADFLVERAGFVPKIAIICGSNLAFLTDDLTNTTQVKYEDIPYFPECTVPNHQSMLVFGYFDDITPVVIMKGRFHFFEGNPSWKAGIPSTVFKLMGVKYLITTSSVVGVNEKYKPGDIMMVKDHINMLGIAGSSPLRGPNDDRIGDRFPSMNEVYERKLRKQAVKIAVKLKINKKLRQGVYGYVCGPSLPTVAEMRMMSICGADVVGMSTVPEVTLAKHCELKVFAVCLVVEPGTFDYSWREARTTQNEAAVRAMYEPFNEFIKRLANFINEIPECTCGRNL
ncbi:unnamed protein product [Phyllotreta striolata]|uniref:purine-nucleoside phosphorylase n=1 Tax=Phyllotreta striolata TaxID=444603 RepID=A0A9N9TYN7_PHYSR|nr:unnamed protein product [Phyllotreta striolata]